MCDTADKIYHDYYATWYRTDPATIASTRAFYEGLLGPHLPVNRSAKILDVGCGVGLALKALQDNGFTDVAGIDINAEQARSASELVGTVTWVGDSTIWLAEHPDAFDFIFSTDVVEHIAPSRQVDFIRAIYGALKPGGSFLCTVPNANSAIAGRWRYLDYTHQASFTEHSLTFLLRAGGFEKVLVDPAEIFRVFRGRGKRLKEFASDVLRVLVRASQRVAMLAELGIDEGRGIPFSVNLLGIGHKKSAESR
jgi:2-polyprenyl-3-methyl-5-hydroxy-6-metoxy-1,4-benzoquinol methylase